MNEKPGSQSYPITRTHRHSWQLLALLTALSATHQGFAHADLDQRIASVTARLEQSPTNAANLYLERADLHCRHLDHELARADLAAAEHLHPEWSEVTLAHARIFSEEGKFPESQSAAEKVLQREPRHSGALLIRARALVKAGKPAEAATDFSEALAQFPAPSPDLFLERATAQATAGNLADAVRGLDEGMRKLGEIPSLQLPAIEYERQAGRWDSALARVDKMMARYPVKESSLALRAEILEQAGRLAQARETFHKVLSGIESYPSFRRNLELTLQLETRVRAGLARIEPKFSASNSQPVTSLQSLK